jgi:MFS family permease
VSTATASEPSLPSLDGIDLSSRAPLGWGITVICSLIALLETTATGAVAGALSNIQDTFSLSDTRAGFIPTAGIAGALLAAPVAAVLADRANRAYVLAAGAVLWAASAVLSAAAPVFLLFLITRVLLGASGQLNNPAASSLIADAHPAVGRAKAYGFERMANYLGLPIGIALGGSLAESIGWRKGFAILAIPALLVAVISSRVRNPPRGLGDTIDRARLANGSNPASEKSSGVEATMSGAVDSSLVDSSLVDSSSEKESLITQLRSVITIPSFRSVLIGVPLLFFALAAVFFWSTRFFEDTQGLTEENAAAIAGAVGGTSIVIGIIIGARLGDRYHRVRPGWRLQLCSVGVLIGLAGFVIMIAGATIGALAIAGFAIANVGMAVAIPNQTAAVADVVSARNRGAAFSTLQFMLALGGAFGPPAVGTVSDAIGSLRTAMAVVLVALAISAWLLRKGAATFDDDAARVVAGIETRK